MPDYVIPLIPALGVGEYVRLDNACGNRQHVADLPALAEFLRAKFSVELTLDQDIIKGFTSDSSNLPGKAEALGRPRSERECAILMRACFAAGIPFTLTAGRSNLTGSATPPEGVVISTAQMMTPELAVNAPEQSVRAPVGMILEEMRKQVIEKSGGQLHFPVDPTSRSDATIGGAVACNASGFTPGERGAIRSWVEAIDLLLPNGTKVSARRGEFVSEHGKFMLSDGSHARDFPVPRYERPAIKNAGGPYSAPSGVIDFVDLIVGSEGIFGTVTACTLRLAPRPSGYLDLFFSLPDESRAVDFLERLRAGLPGGLSVLSALEYFGTNSRRFMSHEGRLFHGGDQVGIYVQQPLSDRSVEEAAGEWLERILGADCGVDENAILLMDNDRDRAIFMEARHSMPAKAVEVVQQRGTFTIMTDTVVPPDRFREFLDFTNNAIRSAGLEYLSFGHMGDCHLHFTMLPEKEQMELGVRVYDSIVAESARLGGVYSGEHGTGKRKRGDFLRCYGQASADQLRSCKAAVDPLFLMNRGNVVEYAGGC